MTVILKLGGSLITDKTQREAIDEPVLDRVCDLLAQAKVTDLIVIHGGGSFGHQAASVHDIGVDRGSNDPHAIQAVAESMDRLNEIVTARLQAVDLPAIGLPPRSFAAKTSTGDLDFSALAVRTALQEGMIPVLHGDIVLHAGAGASILSGDTLAVELAKRIDVDRVGFCAGVPGVLDEHGDVIPRIETYDDVAELVGTTDGADVSGGMETKIHALLALPVPGAIFGIDDLETFLAGELPGTAVYTTDTDTF